MDWDVFIGEIQWDEQYELNQLGEELPKIVLKDGREYDWCRFGRELMTYEGFIAFFGSELTTVVFPQF